MCGILDTNCLSEVFGSNRPEIGKRFFDWFYTGNGRLIVGGKLQRELEKGSEGFRKLALELQRAGRMRIIPEKKVDTEAARLDKEGLCTSDDSHVIALARISGARLLYSNDKDLKKDFGAKSLIDKPRGKVYSTRDENGMLKRYQPNVHGRLLGNRDLCCP